jgi:hypothetical protein
MCVCMSVWYLAVMYADNIPLNQGLQDPSIV